MVFERRCNGRCWSFLRCGFTASIFLNSIDGTDMLGGKNNHMLFLWHMLGSKKRRKFKPLCHVMSTHRLLHDRTGQLDALTGNAQSSILARVRLGFLLAWEG